MDLKFRDRYIKAQTALQEILDSDKTIDNVNVYIGKDRKVIITFDLMGSSADNEKIVTKIEDFIPDFVLELLGDDK